MTPLQSVRAHDLGDALVGIIERHAQSLEPKKQSPREGRVAQKAPANNSE